MSKEFRSVSVAFTVNDPERTAENLGSPVYADDVVDEVSEVIEEAVRQWYNRRGYMMLATKPTL